MSFKPSNNVSKDHTIKALHSWTQRLDVPCKTKDQRISQNLFHRHWFEVDAEESGHFIHNSWPGTNITSDFGEKFGCLVWQQPEPGWTCMWKRLSESLCKTIHAEKSQKIYEWSSHVYNHSCVHHILNLCHIKYLLNRLQHVQIATVRLVCQIPIRVSVSPY